MTTTLVKPEGEVDPINEIKSGIKTAGEVCVAFGSVVAVVVGVVYWIMSNYEPPVAGYTEEFHYPAALPQQQALCVRQYDVFNPSPQTLDSASLRIIVPDKFISADTLPEGLIIQTVVEWELKPCPNGGTICTFMPTGNTLDAGQGFSVRFISNKDNWHPKEGNDESPIFVFKGSHHIDAGNRIARPTASTSLLTIWFHLGLAAAMAIVLFILWRGNVQYRDRLRKYVTDRIHDAETKAAEFYKENTKKLEGKISVEIDEDEKSIQEQISNLVDLKQKIQGRTPKNPRDD